MKKVILVFITSIIINSPTFAQERKKEIMTHVIDPCIKAGGLRKKLSKNMSAKAAAKAVEIIKILNEENFKIVIKDTSKLVKGKNLKTRKKLYRFLKNYCIESLKQDLKKTSQK